MSPSPPTLNPSQTVERIREIIVGRHLERLEGRVERLELQNASAAIKPAPVGDIFEDRLLITEARVEAFQNHIHRTEELREEVERNGAMQKQEVQRLAKQISEIARARDENSGSQAVEKLEHRLGVWLTDWQKALHIRLETRDKNVVGKVNFELAAMREGIEKRFTELESRVPANMEDRFNLIAIAARALAESAVSFSTATSPKS